MSQVSAPPVFLLDVYRGDEILPLYSTSVTGTGGEAGHGWAGSTLAYSTYLGGSAADQVYALAIDGAGNAYVAGATNSADFPLANAYQSTNKAIGGGGSNSTAFVSKLNAAGGALLYSTYLGGSTDDVAQAIAVDSASSAYVAGRTCSGDFPTLDAFQGANNSSCASGGSNAFVTKLNSAGSGLAYSTYLGGSGGDVALGIAVDSAGSAVVVGSTTSQDFPVANPLQGKNMASAIGASNAFVSQFNATGNLLTFSTYWGGSGSWGPSQNHTSIPFGDAAAAVALDGADNIYVAGQTGSADFPTAKPFQATNKTATVYGAGPTAFVTKIAQELVSPIAAPLSVTATGGVNQVTLAWSAVGGATSYNIYQGTVSGGESAVPMRTVYGGTTQVVSGLSNGIAYYYEITAVNVNGESAKSSEVSATPAMTAAGGGGGGSAGWGLLSALGLILAMRSGSWRGRAQRRAPVIRK
ncbi:MAG TPA: SBBP repeat-containing protein [Steroidobacteraceae bacterium]|nr:SBBP repeat-containing protein [Steroidobacteraceae bacterium]